jgi:hypothetical protein
LSELNAKKEESEELEIRLKLRDLISSEELLEKIPQISKKEKEKIFKI